MKNPLIKKVLFFHNGIYFDLKEIVGNGKKFITILNEIDSTAKISGSDKTYIRLYRRFKFLNKKHLFSLVRKKTTNWKKTEENRMQEIESSVQDIFRKAVLNEGGDPFVSTGTLSGDTGPAISTVKKFDSGFYVVPTGELIYLFSQVQNSNLAKKYVKSPSGNWMDKIYDIPSKCVKSRLEAVKTLIGIRDRKLFQRDLTCPKCKKEGKQIPGKKIAECGCGFQWKPPLNRQLKNELSDVKFRFDEWESDILDKDLYFDRGPGTDIVSMQCRTRFTDKGRKVHNVKTYDRAWTRANLLFRRGVFLTLTTDPSLHKSLWHANRHLTRAFNRYISLLLSRKRKNKKKGFDSEKEENDILDGGLSRLKYIAAYEFQENGLIHLHLVFFGIRYLASIDDISQDWQKCGQGRIVHAYSIRKNGDVWEWNKEKPSDNDGRNPVDYLRKYLEKALYVNDSFSLYWVMNKRFCTMSRIFQTKECQGCKSVWGSGIWTCPHCGGPLGQISRGFRFLGSINKNAGPPAFMMAMNAGSSPFDPLGVPVCI